MTNEANRRHANVLYGVSTRQLRLWLCSCYVLMVSTGTSKVTLNMFANTEMNLTGPVGTLGSITYPRYQQGNYSNNSMGKPTTLLLTACQECRISLVFSRPSSPSCQFSKWDFLRIPSNTSCVLGCSYLYFHDPYCGNCTMNVIVPSSLSSESYVSNSRSVMVVFCNGNHHQNDTWFNIEYAIEDATYVPKEEIHEELVSQNYPGPYALNGNIYIYVTHSRGNYIRLTFDGWDLSNESTIMVHYKEHGFSGIATRSLTRRGADPRIIVQSFEYIKVIFIVGSNEYDHVKRPYLGFHANYEYVSDPSWPEFPSIVCGEYFHHLPGGHFESPSCLPGQRVDCLWVIGKPSEVGASDIVDTFETAPMNTSFWQLDIRRGVTADVSLVYRITDSRYWLSSVGSANGMYVRLKYECGGRIIFNVTFAYYDQTTNSRCTNEPYTFKCTNADVCIHRNLTCDGRDHCRDNSDEGYGCTATEPSCYSGGWEYCRNGLLKICAEQICDGIVDCPSGSDEEYCYQTTRRYAAPSPTREAVKLLSPLATMVSIILSCGVVLCIGCCGIIRWCLRRRRPLALQTGRTLALPPVAVRQDAPPAYDYAVQYSPRAGTVNMGYPGSYPHDPFAKPPPYSPNMGHDCTPPPEYEQISALGSNSETPQTVNSNDGPVNPHARTPGHVVANNPECIQAEITDQPNL